MHNRASDTRVVWFPFEALRPATHQPITLARRAVMAVTFGAYAGAFLVARQLLREQPLQLSGTLRMTGLAILVFFAWFSLVTAPLWNRRARREAEAVSASSRAGTNP